MAVLIGELLLGGADGSDSFESTIFFFFWFLLWVIDTSSSSCVLNHCFQNFEKNLSNNCRTTAI